MKKVFAITAAIIGSLTAAAAITTAILIHRDCY